MLRKAFLCLIVLLASASVAIARFTAPAVVGSAAVHVTGGPWVNQPEPKPRPHPKPKPKPRPHRDPKWDSQGSGRSSHCGAGRRTTAKCEGSGWTGHRQRRTGRRVLAGATGRPAYVGGASAAAQSVGLPAGWRPGDLAVVLVWRASGQSSPLGPKGYAAWTAGSEYPSGRSEVFDRVLQPGDTAVSTVGASHIEVVVYRHAAGGGSFRASSGSGASPWLTEPIALHKDDGSASVLVIGADTAASNARAVRFAPPGAQRATANRSAAFADPLMGASDTTDAAILGWGAAPHSTFDALPFAQTPRNGSHVVYTLELQYAPQP